MSEPGESPGMPPVKDPVYHWQPYVLSAIGGVVGALLDDGKIVHFLGAYVPPVWYLAVAYEKTGRAHGAAGNIIGYSIAIGFVGLIAGIMARDLLR